MNLCEEVRMMNLKLGTIDGKGRKVSLQEHENGNSLCLIWVVSTKVCAYAKRLVHFIIYKLYLF